MIFIDVLRVAAVAFVIIHHAAQAYGPTAGFWPVHDRAQSGWFAPFYTANAAFGMGLLFLVAGYFTAASYERKGLRRFVSERWARIGVPLVSLVVLALSVTCSARRPDDSVETVSSALTVTFEAESLARTASATGSQVTSEAGASNGQYVQLSGTPAAGAWIEFTLPNVAGGTYDVKNLYKANFNRGIVQASIDGVNQGSPCDQYSATATQQHGQ